MYDLDNAMDVLDTLEKKTNKKIEFKDSINKRPIGIVEGYFSKINVVAIKLNEELNIGDLIEIGNEDEAVRQRVISMQINKNEVYSASSGDSVGIKLRYKVNEGEVVFKL
ncbi:MAG: hypothetical protein QXD23_01505 [Candidatus Micrarchaeaceae archaeon]